jgi:bifunctional DNA-binding transcriptional regulator/antitoxin component of YhaV-PrlF toxin-antitoxin module
MEYDHTRQIRTTNGETEIEIPDPLVDELGFGPGDDVELFEQDGEIVMRAAE